MANQLFAGFLLNDAGAAIVGATINLYDRNTTTPVRATTTTDANGYWTISHATEGRFDVEEVSSSSKRRRMYDTSQQMTALEVQTLRVRNPAFTFDYDIVPAAITADRQLNLPLITATDTLVALALAQTFLTGAKTFNDNILTLRNPADTFSYSLRTSAITAARDLTAPLLTANDTLAVLAEAQTFLTGVKTFRSSILAIRNPADTFSYTLVASAITAARNLTIPLLTADDTVEVLGLAQTITALKTFTSGIATAATAASAGAIRFGSSDFMNARNAANAADVQVIGLNASDQVVVGGGGAAPDVRFPAGRLVFDAAINMAFDTVTGTKLGTATSQKLSTYNATPIVQGATVADADGTLASVNAQLNTLLARIRAFGVIAT